MSEKRDTGHSPPRALIEQGLSFFFDYGSVQVVAVVLRYLKNVHPVGLSSVSPIIISYRVLLGLAYALEAVFHDGKHEI